MKSHRNPRIVNETKIAGCFGLPIGVTFLNRETSGQKFVVVSTVQLDGAHIEDPLRICSPETGFETMVFLEGCTLFSLFTQKYSTRKAASYGHRSVVRRIISGKLPIAIGIHYYAWEDGE